MRAFFAFFKKEWMEYGRSYKLFALFMVFCALGVMNPPTAKFLPELLSSALADGMEIHIPEPTVLDSWAQFFKNVSQMGLIIMLVLFSGIMSAEFSRGTLVHILTKGMHRSTVIWAKWSFAVLCWTVCYYAAFLITYVYNLAFWEQTGAPNLGWAVSFVWLYGLCLLSFLFLGSVLLKSTAGGLLGVLLVFGVGMVVSLFPKIEKFSPSKLVLNNMELLQKSVSLEDFLPCIVVTLVLCAAGITGSVVMFKKSSI